MMEEWRRVIGFEGLYEVSSSGRVRNHRGRIMALPKNQDGYLRLSLCREGLRKDALVHHLVLEAFIGPRPDGMQACHSDGSRDNNIVGNLRWDTQTSNQRDRILHGTHTRGERCGTSRFTEAQVRLIRSLKGVFSNTELARIFGCSKSGIGLVQARISWRHL